MTRFPVSALVLPALVLPVVLLCGAAQAEDLTVSGAFARASMGQGPGAAYVTIHGGDSGDKLVSVSSPRAKHVALHSMTMQGDVMRMRKMEAIEVPAKGEVTLAPGGLHLMLEGMSSPLKQGETIPLVLEFEKAGTRNVEAPVRGPGARSVDEK